MTTIKMNQPFDAANPEFIEELCHPEKLDDEIKFYALISSFAITALRAKERAQNTRDLSSLAQDLLEGSANCFKDQARAGTYMAVRLGFPQPEGFDFFYQKTGLFDAEKIKWGARLYRAILDNPVAKQTWTLDRSALVHQSKADGAFTGDYDFRVEHGGTTSSCTAEHHNAQIRKHRAAFDLKMVNIARERMWEAFWSRGKTALQIQDAVGMFFRQAVEEHQEEDKLVDKLEEETNEALRKDELLPYLDDLYEEIGGIKGNIFV